MVWAATSAVVVHLTRTKFLPGIRGWFLVSFGHLQMDQSLLKNGHNCDDESWRNPREVAASLMVPGVSGKMAALRSRLSQQRNLQQLQPFIHSPHCAQKYL